MGSRNYKTVPISALPEIKGKPLKFDYMLKRDGYDY